jgi:hypothetical protein
MGKKTSPSHTISSINIKITTKIISFNANHQHQRIVQNDLLISVDGNMDQSNKDRSNTLAQLRNVVNDVNVVTQSDKCVNFLTETELIRESVHQVVKQCHPDSIAMSVVARFLAMKHNRESINNSITYCCNGDNGSTINITRFENEHNVKLAIQWCSYPLFIYSLLNSAFRILQAKSLFSLHSSQQVEELHRKQVCNHHGISFIVYR